MEKLKKKAAQKAVSFIKDGMIVGLGTGSTVELFIESLALSKKKIKVVASSNRSLEKAKRLKLSIVNIEGLKHIDITVDGTDEVDGNKNMIKGGGGALFREKILAENSKQVLIIADESKKVEMLGKIALPVEILPFGYNFTKKKLEQLDCSVCLRKIKKNIFITDNNNYILDLKFSKIEFPKKLYHVIRSVTGVVEIGLFFDLNAQVIIASKTNIEVF